MLWVLVLQNGMDILCISLIGGIPLDIEKVLFRMLTFSN